MTQFDEDNCDKEIDPEGPDESEMDFSDEPDLEICPSCRKLITEEAHQCPHCGEYVTPGAVPWPKWAWVVIAIVAITALLLAIRL
jgi:RNA polymerase subunit RPABC4/transcription elongation factor Spt4